MISELSAQHATTPYEDIEIETLDYTIDETAKTHLRAGAVILNPQAASVLEQYTFSNALSLSVKLATWEAALEKYIESISVVTDGIKDGQGVKLSRKEVFQKTGQLFRIRHEINLNSDLLDTPDFYWEREKLEQLFRLTCSAFNIQRRTRVMNEKLNNCVDLMELVGHHLDDGHHTRLEKIIIYLIMVEVVFEIIHFIERYVDHSSLEIVTNAVD